MRKEKYAKKEYIFQGHLSNLRKHHTEREKLPKFYVSTLSRTSPSLALLARVKTDMEWTRHKVKFCESETKS